MHRDRKTLSIWLSQAHQIHVAFLVRIWIFPGCTAPSLPLPQKLRKTRNKNTGSIHESSLRNVSVQESGKSACMWRSLGWAGSDRRCLCTNLPSPGRLSKLRSSKTSDRSAPGRSSCSTLFRCRRSLSRPPRMSIRSILGRLVVLRKCHPYSRRCMYMCSRIVCLRRRRVLHRNLLYSRSCGRLWVILRKTSLNL